jgi:hypothetical protein
MQEKFKFDLDNQNSNKMAIDKIPEHELSLLV